MPMPVQNKDRSDEVFLLALDRFETELRRFKSRRLPVTIHDLEKLENRIMSAISDYAAKVNAAFDKLGTAVDGVADDVTFLKEEIKKLQDNPGPISPEDQAILDGVQARADTLASKVEALDQATERPPTPTP
jgi:hypothetical protein